MAVKKELVDELLKDADPKKVFGSEGLLDDIKKALAERMLSAELDIPRDRRGSFEPQLIAKYQRRFPGFDEKIVSM